MVENRETSPNENRDSQQGSTGRLPGRRSYLHDLDKRSPGATERLKKVLAEGAGSQRESSPGKVRPSHLKPEAE